jgi:hypothetical protein
VEENVRDGAAELLGLIARYESGEAGGHEENRLLETIERRGGWEIDSRVKMMMTELGCPPAGRRTGTSWEEAENFKRPVSCECECSPSGGSV